MPRELTAKQTLALRRAAEHSQGHGTADPRTVSSLHRRGYVEPRESGGRVLSTAFRITDAGRARVEAMRGRRYV